MMKNRKNLSEEVRQTMESLDTLTRATPGPFFYTRLKARMEGSQNIAMPLWYSWVLQPRWSLPVITMLVILNIGAIWWTQNHSSSQTSPKQDYLESLSKEISSGSSDYEPFYNF
ncbi:MAG: hypothetical protein SF052_02835 [Bacteroidia bacterium]|nr:hypothetical protein [Bacteroidia bacterium]